MVKQPVSLRRLGVIRALLAIVAIVTSAACFVHRANRGVVTDTMFITEAEIESAHVGSALEVIYRLRPMFLATRGRMSLDPKTPAPLPNVYVDEMYYGDASTLRAIDSHAIESIRFYSGPDAQYRYGRGNVAGVISIATKH